MVLRASLSQHASLASPGSGRAASLLVRGPSLDARGENLGALSFRAWNFDKNYIGRKILPTSIKPRETHWIEAMDLTSVNLP
eukprot:1152705-Pelagomonas_calceolata.AAC.1